jgi:hypothetical protein
MFTLLLCLSLLVQRCHGECVGMYELYQTGKNRASDSPLLETDEGQPLLVVCPLTAESLIATKLPG